MLPGTAYIFELSWDLIREGPLKPITQVDIFMNVDTALAHQVSVLDQEPNTRS